MEYHCRAPWIPQPYGRRPNGVRSLRWRPQLAAFEILGWPLGLHNGHFKQTKPFTVALNTTQRSHTVGNVPWSRVLPYTGNNVLPVAPEPSLRFGGPFC